MPVPVICFKLVALVGPVLLLGCMGMIAVGLTQPVITYGFGAEKNEIGVLQTCFAAIGDQKRNCVDFTHPDICSEIASKLNVVLIMSCISAFNMLVTMASIVADIQGCKIPVVNLTRILFAWSIVPTMFSVAVMVMAMVNPQCTDTQSLSDQEGAYGPGFQTIASSFFGQMLALLVHTGAMVVINSLQQQSVVNDDEDEEEELAPAKPPVKPPAKPTRM